MEGWVGFFFLTSTATQAGLLEPLSPVIVHIVIDCHSDWCSERMQ